MRATYVVTYDISCPKRLRRVFRVMRGFGDHLQLSVFRCELTPTELILMRRALLDAIDGEEDQVLIIDLGPTNGRARDAIAALGRAYTRPERHAVIV